jgi:ferrous iron transport protein A
MSISRLCKRTKHPFEETAIMVEKIGLRKLKVDQKAVIHSVHAQGDLGRRIREMGLIPGTEIVVTGRAPLRDPVALRLNGFTLTLRNNEADHISVEVADDE